MRKCQVFGEAVVSLRLPQGDNEEDGGIIGSLKKMKPKKGPGL